MFTQANFEATDLENTSVGLSYCTVSSPALLQLNICLLLQHQETLETSLLSESLSLAEQLGLVLVCSRTPTEPSC